MKKLVFLCAVFCFTAVLSAADYDIYGKIGMGGWWMKSKGMHIDSLAWDSVGNPVEHKDSIPIHTNIMTPGGVLGFRFKAGQFGGCVELATRMNVYDSRMSGSTTYMSYYTKKTYFTAIEKWYAEWYLNDHLTILMGQDITPTNFFPSSSVFAGGIGLRNIGGLYTGSSPMFQMTLQAPGKGFEARVAIVKVDTVCIEYFNHSDHDVTYHCETKLPKLELGFGVNMDQEIVGFTAKAAGGIQRYNSVAFAGQIVADECRLDILSYIGGAEIGAKIGPVKIGGNVFFGQNIGAYGASFGYEWGWWRLNDFMRQFFPIHIRHGEMDSLTGETVWVDTTYYNSQALEFAAVIGFAPADFISVESGVGIMKGYHEWDYLNDKWDMAVAAYLQTSLKLLDQLVLTPELGYYQYAKNRQFFYWGLNTHIEF